jgi:hypothetical protein
MSLVDLERMAHRFDEIALAPQTSGVPVFRCPVCGRNERSDATAMEPACTGPSWTDDHELTVMVRIADDQPRTVIYLRA